MKIFVLVPSADYSASAGARIRYQRIASELARREIHLELKNIAQFDVAEPDCDVLLISKCHDARSVIAAAAASNAGKLVGIDLFDDYFSDGADSRLSRYRDWLTQIIRQCDFVLCSTAAMGEVGELYRPGIPVHQMNDPSPAVDFDSLAKTISKKHAAARERMCIQVGWFGVGDNPHFPLGLADLAAFGSALNGLRQDVFDVELTVLTNRRAITGDGLSLLAKLPVRTTLKEWSENAEQELLEQVMVAFLPVNGQPFSKAKSLNRAVTALSGGCQVLSVGYPLYAALEPFIYRDVAELLSDVANGSLRLSARTLKKYGRAVVELASAEAEAERLHSFLGALTRAAVPRSTLLSVIHGHSTRDEAHSFIRAAGGLSVASPYCSAPFDFDVKFEQSTSGLQMLVSRKAMRRLLPAMSERARKAGEYFCLPDAQNGPLPQLRLSTAPLPLRMAAYSTIMRHIERSLKDAFGPVTTIFSEMSRMPFPPTSPASASR